MNVYTNKYNNNNNNLVLNWLHYSGNVSNEYSSITGLEQISGSNWHYHSIYCVHYRGESKFIYATIQWVCPLTNLFFNSINIVKNINLESYMRCLHLDIGDKSIQFTLIHSYSELIVSCVVLPNHFWIYWIIFKRQRCAKLLLTGRDGNEFKFKLPEKNKNL